MLGLEPVRNEAEFRGIAEKLELTLPEWKPSKALSKKLKSEVKDQKKGRNALTSSAKDLQSLVCL